MSYILLLHWNAEEAEERSRRLQDWGHEIRILSGGDAKSLRPFVQDPPAAAIIDLGRLPSQGREIGTYLRRRKSTRRVPLVFVGGQDEKSPKRSNCCPMPSTQPGQVYASLGGLPDRSSLAEVSIKASAVSRICDRIGSACLLKAT